MSKHCLVTIILISVTQFSLLLEYTKNKDIKLRDHSNTSYVHNITNSLQLTQMFKKEKHFIMLFISDWCISCPEISHTFSKASGYMFTQNIIDFYRIDCWRGNEICSEYNITKYPTKKVFLYQKPKFVETEAIPSGDTLDDLLEYVDKIGSRPLTKLSSMKAVNKFSKEHGDVSYLLVVPSSKDDTNELLSCLSSIASLPFNMPQYYFAYINQQHYHNHYDIKIPSIVLLGTNKELNINKAVSSCQDMKDFTLENQYPLMKRIDLPYLNKLHMRGETVIIVTMNKDSISQVQHIMTLVQNIAVNRRDLIFGYLDVNEDRQILLFFKEIQEESVIVYNFQMGKYYLDTYKDDALKIKQIVHMLDNNQIIWLSGYLLEDFFNRIGIKWTRTTFIFVIFCILSVVVISCFIGLCSCINSIDNKFKIN